MKDHTRDVTRAKGAVGDQGDPPLVPPLCSLPHPDPRLAGVELSLVPAPGLWARWALRAADATGRPEHALWERWLTPAGFRQLRDSTALPGPIDPAAAIGARRLVWALLESPRRPLALRLDADPAARTAAGYLLVLGNGATVVLRDADADCRSACIEEIYFSPAAERATLDSGRPGHRSMDGHVRDSVVRSLVNRYGLALNDAQMTGLVPPDRPCGVLGSISAPVRFLNPTAWGFAGGQAGCRWEGPPDDDAGDREPVAVALRAVLDGGRAPTLPAHADAGPRRTGRCDRPDVSPAESARDPLALLKTLRQSLLDCGLGDVPASAPTTSCSATSRADAYQAAKTLGLCRLVVGREADSSSPPPPGLSPLPAAVARSATGVLLEQLKRLRDDAIALPARLMGAPVPLASDLCLGLLEARLESWAVYLAIDESYEEGRDGELAGPIDSALDRLDAVDESLEAIEPLLDISQAGIRWRENWMTLLALPYRDCPPWWLEPR